MRLPLPADIPAAESLGRVHFVGVGGAALSGLARIMVARGVAVTGSDVRDGPHLDGLRKVGVTCWVGHDAAHVTDADIVVVSTAVHEDNPEVRAARKEGIALWPRAAAVQSVLRDRTAVVVTGTHGKTTTTGMLTTALRACGADPSYAVGATLAETGVNAADGSDPIFVAEGDESDGAILAYRPHGAVITTVDADHLDQYGSVAEYQAVFEEFLTRIEPGGFLVVGADDPGAAGLAAQAEERGLRVLRAGLSPSADVSAQQIRLAGQDSHFQLWCGSNGPVETTLHVPGRVYVADAVCAVAAGTALGFDVDALCAGLGRYAGSARRMQHRGVAAGIRVYDSYAHHPAEIVGDVAAARELAGGGRLVVCFQPHLYSRTRAFSAQMGQALGAADEVLVLDVYPAREERQPGVTGELVSAAVPLSAQHVGFEPERGAAARRLAERVRPGDLVLTLGAGDVTDVGPELLQLLAEKGVHG